jgi:hypothetical protein
MHANRLPFVAWFLAIIFTIVLGHLGYLAITERSITTGGRGGIHHAEGTSAVVLGFGFIGFALASLGSLAIFNRFRNLIWLFLSLLWLSSITIYALYAR